MKVSLLDCTLRDGGYINDWRFGKEVITGFNKKIAETGIEFFEVGFLKGNSYDPDRAIYPDVISISKSIQFKSTKMIYVAMIDMSDPIPLERIVPYDGTSIDGIRVIFKKNKIDVAYEYCEQIQKLGYFVFVNFVGTDLYTDKEFIEGIEKFNVLHPYAVSIVDSFGLIKRKQFLRLVYIADNNLLPDISLAYHAHNNLQQALGNAQTLVELGLNRSIIIDACVFGMGRGAGNLNLELFAEFMNDNYNTDYKIEPMLEIMDEYLNNIYMNKFWGYSLPLYLSAVNNCHPNYAILYAQKNSLGVKSMNEIMRSMSNETKQTFSSVKAEELYKEYQQQYVDDAGSLTELNSILKNKKILILAPGYSIKTYKKQIGEFIDNNFPIIVSVNFIPDDYLPDYIFCTNERRATEIEQKGIDDGVRLIISSNIAKNLESSLRANYVVNYSSLLNNYNEVRDNATLMLFELLIKINVTRVYIAGFDGYSSDITRNYADKKILLFENDDYKYIRNKMISEYLVDRQKTININFLTPSIYLDGDKND